MLLGMARFSGGRLIKTRLISCTSGTRERILQKRLARRGKARRGEANLLCSDLYCPARTKKQHGQRGSYYEERGKELEKMETKEEFIIIVVDVSSVP